jgi:RNA polymerase sigma-70 factor (ECF subfamily)
MGEFIESETIESKPLSDQEAIALLKAGNINGLAVLVRRYQVKAVQTALFITCDRGLAEEVAQEAFLKAYRKIHQFDASRPFSPWFLRIVINAAKKLVKKQGRFQPLDNSDSSHALAMWLIDPTEGPEKLSETAETREEVWEAIRSLTPDQREAVVMRYFLGAKEREMVQALGRPASTVKWWLYAARQRLRQILEPGREGRLEKEEVSHEG